MIEACRAAGRPEPRWESEADGLRLVLPSPQPTPEATPEVPPEVTPEVRALLAHCREPHSRKELQSLLGLKDPDHFRLAYLQPALAAGLIEMTIPDKPTSSAQKYRATATGKSFLPTGGA
jgi:ATP-dependent DNA helicase RecG